MNPRHPKGPSPLAGNVGDSRAELIPCPILRTLLNEGWIHSDEEGRVRLDELHEALDRLGLDPLSTMGLVAVARLGGRPDGIGCPHADALSRPAPGETFSLYCLREGPLMHNADTAALRAGYDPARLEELLANSSEGGWLTLDDLARSHGKRVREEPGLHGSLQGGSELAAMFHVFGKPNARGEQVLEREDLIRLYRDNRFPKGWSPPKDRAWQLPLTMARFFGSQWFGKSRP